MSDQDNYGDITIYTDNTETYMETEGENKIR